MAGLTEHQIEARIGMHGIKHPVWTVEKARLEKLDVKYACAMLMLESSGGDNIFGRDWDFQYAGMTVTKARYEVLCADIRAGHPSNGVGPCQLTSVGLLEEADKYGGAWLIPHNLAIGFHTLHGLIQQHGSAEAGAAAYNGSGPAAEAYGRRFMTYAIEFAHILV
jgi:hypothetical protein